MMLLCSLMLVCYMITNTQYQPLIKLHAQIGELISRALGRLLSQSFAKFKPSNSSRCADRGTHQPGPGALALANFYSRW